VYLSEKDMEKLMARLVMDRNSFIKTYCRWVSDWRGKKVLSLKEKSNKDCILWDKGCLAYTARPLQCRAFPFWNSIISSVKSWEMAASGCPGMNFGHLHSADEIDAFINARITEPIIEKKGGSK
jgi:Fe-S-cluster containining protein